MCSAARARPVGGAAHLSDTSRMPISAVILLCALAGAAVLFMRAVDSVKRGSETMLEAYARMLERARAAAAEDAAKSDEE